MSAQRRIDPADVRRLAAAGLCAREIAAKLGFARSTVRRAARIDRCTMPVPTAPHGNTANFWEQHSDELLTLYDTGMSASWIARKLSRSTGERVTKNMVVGRLDRLGLIGGDKKGRPALVLVPRLRVEFPPERGCRFPIGTPGKPGFAFCGERTIEIGMPYCCEHHRITHKPTAPMKEAA